MIPAAVVEPIDGVTGAGWLAGGGANGVAGADGAATAGEGESPAKLGAGIGAGIFGESFQGIPLRGLPEPGAGVAARAGASWASGGRTVRAVSMGSGSRVGGLTAGVGAGSGSGALALGSGALG